MSSTPAAMAKPGRPPVPGQEIVRGRNANRVARNALRRIAEEQPGPRTLAMLLLKAANALGENQDALQELEGIGQEARKNGE